MLRRKNLLLFDRFRARGPSGKVNFSLHIPSPLERSLPPGTPGKVIAARQSYYQRKFSSSKTPESPLQKPSLISRLQREFNHYLNGSKLFAMEVRISSRLVKKVLRGQPLIRREQEQLKRTVSDLFRLVPFSVFIIVPFLEFALPFALRLFPGMLPSTFSDALQEEEKRVKQIKLKLQMARFLQHTLEHMANQEGASCKAANELWQAYLKCKASGQAFVSTDDLVQLGKAFGDQLTLDTFNRRTLASICKYMGFSAVGTDGMLRFRIRRAMSKLKADDQLIWEEGGSTALTEPELRNACHDRGITASKEVPATRLREELDQWIDLHLQQQLPFPILILSRALSMQLGVEEALRETLSSAIPTTPLPAETLVVEANEKRQTMEQINQVQQEERLIQEELGTREQPQADETQVIAKAIDAFASDSPIEREKEELARIKDALSREETFIYTHPTSPTTRKLASQVEHIVQELDTDLVKAEQDLSQRLHLISTGLAGSLSREEIERVLQVWMHPKYRPKIAQLLDQYDKDKDGLIFLSEIRQILTQNCSD